MNVAMHALLALMNLAFVGLNVWSYLHNDTIVNLFVALFCAAVFGWLAAFTLVRFGEQTRRYL